MNTILRKYKMLDYEEYYVGCNIEDEDEYEYGSYYDLRNNENIDEDSIIYCDHTADMEFEYFVEYIKSAINKYEKRYRTNVVGIGLIGSIGLWHGSYTGGKLGDISNKDNIGNFFINTMGDYDNVIVRTDNDGKIQVELIHHDGGHYLNIHLITENKLKKIKMLEEYERYGFEYFDSGNMEDIAKVTKPMVLRSCEYYG